MSIPLIGQEPAGVCIVCKGQLTPDHKHIYVDEKYLQFVEAIVDVAFKNGCLVMTDRGILPIHPPLSEEYLWYPVKITHTTEHGECPRAFPHHHCEDEDDMGAG